jgi:folate-dependent phosphoribosylglycinamide formyltransferase PurN
MTVHEPSLFDSNNHEEPVLPSRQAADLQAIIDDQKRERDEAQREIERRTAEDEARVERAAEQGVDLTTHQDAQKSTNQRGIEKARQTLQNINPPEEI